MNIEDCSFETIQNFVKRKFDKNLNNDEKIEENYCVDSWENVKFDREFKDLIFSNDCKMISLKGGDGVIIDEKFVQAITRVKKDGFTIYLKGSKSDYSDEKILYEADE